jgi:hypothetical protein
MRRFSILAAVFCALAFAAPAAAATASGPTADCNVHQQLTAHYTVSQLRRALATMPAEIKEYTDCYDVIQRQLLAQLGKPGSASGTNASSSSGSSFLPTPVIVVLVLLILAGVTFGAVALRKRLRPDKGSKP